MLLSSVIVNIITLVLIYLLSRYYILPYINEKGKNLATKEDIGSITKIVEQVKNDFVKETETLKANLQVYSSQKQVLINEERKALLYFLEQLNCLYNMCIDTEFGGHHINDDINYIRAYQNKISSFYYNTLNGSIQIKLYIEDHDFYILALKLLDCIIGFKQSTVTCLLQYEFCINQIDLINAENKDTKYDEIAKIYTDESNYLDIHRKYVKEHNANYIDLIKEYVEKARAYIYKHV